MSTENKEKLAVNKKEQEYNSLGLKYNMDSFEYCADNNIELSDLQKFSPSNLRLLVQIGVEGHSLETVKDIINKWVEKGYSLPMLHILALKGAKKSGFFMQAEDLMEIMADVRDKDKANETLMALPTVQPYIADVMNLMRFPR